MNNILSKKQGDVHIITKSLNQDTQKYENIVVEIQPLNEYENSTFVLDDMLFSTRESKINLFYTIGRHHNVDLYHVSQSCFDLPKKLFVTTPIYLFYLNKL